MTILCHGDCHVFLGASALCTCEVHRLALIGNYYPRPPTPPTADDLPDIPAYLLRAAHDVEGATHLSSNGQRVYIQRLGNVRVCFWDEEMKAFGSSFPCDGLPADVVRM